MMNKKVKEEVKIYQANDWDIIEETPEYVKLGKNTSTLAGHLIVFLLAGWWTLGLANLVYWLASRKTRKVMK